MLEDLLKTYHSKFVAARTPEARFLWLEAAFIAFDLSGFEPGKSERLDVSTAILEELCLVEAEDYPDHAKFENGSCVDCGLTKKEAKGTKCRCIVNWAGQPDYPYEDWRETAVFASRVGWYNLQNFEPTRGGLKLWKLDQTRDRNEEGSQPIKIRFEPTDSPGGAA